MSKKRTIEEWKKIIRETTHLELLSDEYVSRKTKMKFRCECGNEFETTINSIKASNKQYCNKCSMITNMRKRFAKTQEQFELEVKKRFGDEYTVLGKYININTKIAVKHNKCGHVYEVRPSAMIKQGNGCPKCFGKHKKTTDEFKKEIFNLFEDEYEVIGEYVNAKTPIMMKHNKCGNMWEITPTGFLRYKTCTFCTSRSKGEDKIVEVLTEKNISFEREKRFDDCRAKKKLPFDFYLNDFNMLIEYDGIQHFKPSFNEKEFKNTKIHDAIKNEYCKKNNIKLLRIPYWKFNNIENILENALK